MKTNPLLLLDFYKTQHHRMLPKGLTKLYSNLTPRRSRIEGIDAVVVWGIQHFILEYLIKEFNDNFFNRDYESVIEEYSRHVKLDDYDHILALWSLGYLPIEIKALEEGTLCPVGVPMLTITNTHPDFAWLVNYLETLMSCMLWQGITTATISKEYRKILTQYCKETDEKNIEFVNWQGHDFSMRGMSSVETAILSGMAHLAVGFTGTDTVPAIYQLEKSYNATGLIGASVPATEHSIEMLHFDYETEREDAYIDFLLTQYPTGIISAVSDGKDLWKLITDVLPRFKERIMSRDGELVVRPDSGNPVDIICGVNPAFGYVGEKDVCENKGVIELLWDIFGGTVNEQGYKVLDPHIGAIYGDGIGLHNLVEICERLRAKGFASTNIVFGFGSYGYQYNTRDTFGFAVKATFGEITTEVPEAGFDPIVTGREIFKDPITDDGTKKSKKGLLQVNTFEKHHGECDLMGCMEGCMGICKELSVKDQCTKEEEQQGLLTTVFLNGELTRETTLDEVRERLNNN